MLENYTYYAKVLSSNSIIHHVCQYGRRPSGEPIGSLTSSVIVPHHTRTLITGQTTVETEVDRPTLAAREPSSYHSVNRVQDTKRCFKGTLYERCQCHAG